MPLVSMRQLLDHAAENGYGIPAFNVNNLEQVQAVMSAADEVGAPVILQASAGARKYAGEPFIKHLIQAAAEMYPHIPLVMHQDHGTSPKVCEGAIHLGFGSVMMDGSLMEDGKTPASFDYNVDVTRRVVDMAHKVGVTVEGELGCLGSLETMKGDKEDGHGAEGHMTREDLLTDVEQAAVLMAVAGIVDHDVDAAKGVQRCLHHLIELAAMRHIGLRPDRVLADIFGNLPCADMIQVGHHNLGAFLGKTPRHSFAEAGSSAGDDRDFVEKT